MGGAHDFGEGFRAVERVEEVRKRAGKNSFDTNYRVARVEQIAKRVNNRQPGADVRFVKKISARLTHCVVQFLIFIKRSRISFLVRGDDVESALEPRFILARQLGAGGRVNDDCVRQVTGVNVFHKPRQVRLSITSFQPIGPSFQIQMTIVQEHPAAVHYSAHAQIDAALRF